MGEKMADHGGASRATPLSTIDESFSSEFNGESSTVVISINGAPPAAVRRRSRRLAPADRAGRRRRRKPRLTTSECEGSERDKTRRLKLQRKAQERVERARAEAQERVERARAEAQERVERAWAEAQEHVERVTAKAQELIKEAENETAEEFLTSIQTASSDSSVEYSIPSSSAFSGEYDPWSISGSENSPKSAPSFNFHNVAENEGEHLMELIRENEEEAQEKNVEDQDEEQGGNQMERVQEENVEYQDEEQGGNQTEGVQEEIAEEQDEEQRASQIERGQEENVEDHDEEQGASQSRASPSCLSKKFGWKKFSRYLIPCSRKKSHHDV